MWSEVTARLAVAARPIWSEVFLGRKHTAAVNWWVTCGLNSWDVTAAVCPFHILFVYNVSFRAVCVLFVGAMNLLIIEQTGSFCFLSEPCVAVTCCQLTS